MFGSSSAGKQAFISGNSTIRDGRHIGDKAIVGMGSVVVRNVEDGAVVKGNPAKYKGMIEIRTSKSNNGFNIVNVLDIDNYLRGVVPNEMPVSFGLEALKAQAIAARNYPPKA